MKWGGRCRLRRRSLRRAGAMLALCVAVQLLAGCSGLLSWNGGGHRGYGHRSRGAPADGSATVVRRGDTLYSIAFRNNLDYHDVAAWNGIGRDYTIYPGQRLRLTPPSGNTTRVARSAKPSPPVTQSSGGITTAPAVVARSQPTASPLETPAPPGSPTFSSSHWRWPVSGRVVQGFDPDHGSKGIDIAGHLGQTVVAAAPGKVVYSGSALKGYGELVIIKHDERYLSAYGYNRRRLVEEGQWVRAGQAIAELGEGPQQRDELHFEIRDRGKPVDPLTLLPSR